MKPMLIPSDIMKKAHDIALWCKINGYEDWVIGPVADRRLVDRDYVEKQAKTATSGWFPVYSWKCNPDGSMVIQTAPDQPETIEEGGS